MADAAEIRAGRIDLYSAFESKRPNATVPGDVEHKRMPALGRILLKNYFCRDTWHPSFEDAIEHCADEFRGWVSARSSVGRMRFSAGYSSCCW
jgi:hypothetical protein